MINTGKPVEWQVAREIRTTDWDRLRKVYSSDDNNIHSFRVTSPQRSDNEGYLETRPSKSTSNLNYSEAERYQYRTEPNTIEESNKQIYSNYLLERSSQPSSNPSFKSKNSDPPKSLKSNKIINSDKSDHNDTSLFEHQQSTYNQTQGSDRTQSNTESSSSSLGKRSSITKVIRDPDSNEILSIKKINDQINSSINNASLNSQNNTRYTYQTPENNNEENEDLDRSNVSVIDITYNTQKSTRSFKLDSENMDESPTTSLPTIPNLPPPLQFQQSNSISNKSQMSNKSTVANDTQNLTNVSVINIVPKMNSVVDDAKLSSNSSHKDSEMEYDEEYFRTTNEINLNDFKASENSPNVNDESFRFEKPVENNDEVDLLSEIKKFNSNNLRPMSRVSDQPLLYEKNIELLNTPRSSISKTAAQSAIKEEDASSSVPKFNNFDALY